MPWQAQTKPMMMTLIQVAIGGAVGAVLRLLTQLAAARVFGAGFPYGTLVVNVAGSFLMGVMFVLLMGPKGPAPFGPLLMTGLLGGFTTFSAFSLDAFLMYEAGKIGLAAVYVVGSVFLSLAGLVAGVMMIRGMLA